MSGNATDEAALAALRAAVASNAANEPGWLAEARRAALDAHDGAALPDRVAHLWRYTDPRKLLPGARLPQAPAETFGPLTADCTDGTFAGHSGIALAREGRVLRVAVDPETADAGLVVADIRMAAAEHEELVRPHLFSLLAPAHDKFEQLSVAAHAGGAFVHVPRGLTVPNPVHVIHRVSGDGLVASRSLVHVGENAEVTVVFDLAGIRDDETSKALIHEGIEVVVEAAARVRVVFVQQLGSRAVHVPVVRCRVGRDARLETVTVALGGRTVKSLQTTELAGRGASVRVLGIVYADRRQHLDHHTLQDHLVGYTDSDLDYRAVVADRARSAYTGNLRIGLEGEGADAHQRNHNLLLSEHARADTIPELEILTNDVTCSHAAAVGPIDEDMIYFARCRGLREADARRLIVMGFLEPVIARVPDESLAIRIRDTVNDRLGAVLPAQHEQDDA